MLKRFIFAAIVCLAVFSIAAQADTTVLTWGEQNGPGYSWPNFLDAGTDLFAIPADEVITGAVFTSTFGNSSYPNTAIMDVDVNGVNVGSCSNMSDPCWTANTPTPFSYTYTAADLASLSSGSADLTINQTDCCTIRLGASTLTITSDSMPEPSALSPTAAFLLALACYLRRKRVISVR